MKQICAVLVLISLAVPVLAGPNGRKTGDTTAVFTDDGDAPVLFSISCSSQAWTVLVSSDSISRSLLAQWGTNNLVGVCISSTTTSGTVCDDSIGGVELSSTTVAWSDNTKAGWNCRSRANASNVGILKGYRARDSGDYGAISR